jgi:N-acetylneuraminate synthase
MQNRFDFKDLFVLDMANNHQGDVAHGRNIIRSMGKVVRDAGVRAALKFQFRQLDSFIHPDHQEGSELKYVQRFMSTRMEPGQFQTMLDDVRAAGLLSMCTPFDEESVSLIVDMDFDIIKVASCSAKDWPLLEVVADAGKPVIASTGSLAIEDIDNLVSLFQHRGVDFALMHCVAIYPIPDERMVLNQIPALKDRYPDLCIGWSTHEDPGDTVPVQMAVALGADLFERHVGVETDEIKLNAYSSTPEQVASWLEAYKRAKVLCGPAERPPASAEEQASIDGLRRGVFARGSIGKGQVIERDRVYFAIPYSEGQLESGLWKPGIVARRDFAANEALDPGSLEISEDPDVKVIKSAIHEVKAMLNEARIRLGTEFKVEYSHHHGIANFRETGTVIIECINREYCKKLLVQLPGQRHPAHYHARKEETFQILYGELSVDVDGRVRELLPGDTMLIQPGVWHSFWTDKGCIFEEVSTTHYDDDSFYQDRRVNKMQRFERKTIVDNWGRFQLQEKAARILTGVGDGGTAIRCVVFDFDGTLVDSNEIKRRAYFEVAREFDSEGELVQRAMDRCSDGDRYQITRVLAADLSRRGLLSAERSTEDVAEQLADAYTNYCIRAISECDEVAGATEALRQLNQHGIPVFVNTGAPAGAVLPIMKARELDQYLAGVYGSPASKLENLLLIADQLGLRPEDVLAVGDGEGDREAAAAFGCTFVGVAPKGVEAFSVEPHHRIPHLLELPELLAKLTGWSG